LRPRIEAFMASSNFVRPNFLLIEPPPEQQAVTTRRLAMQMAKFNVLPAESVAEGFAILKKFPNLDAIVLHPDAPGADDTAAIKELKSINDSRLLIAIGERSGLSHADHYVPDDAPNDELVELLRRLFGDPRGKLLSSARPTRETISNLPLDVLVKRA
jgi:hypothetical protein